MENQPKKSLQNLILSVIGIWAIVLQNAGIIPTNQNVSVVNTVDADVSGRIEVGNTVDIDIKAINGKRNVFYDNNYDGNYHRIPVFTGN